MNLPLAIIGCGGMGGRHLLGLKELLDSGLNNIALTAVCDLRRDNAEKLADDAAELLGKRPRVFDDMSRMAAEARDLQAVDITTDAGSHHKVACAAFDLGWHVLCEKPLALTMRGCNLILRAQARSGKMLSVAENYRRDPMSRLTRALLDAGAIGQPTMCFYVSAGGGDQIVILPWRHYKHMGGILLDAGVHDADMMQYYLGDAREVYAQARLWEPTRRKPTAPTNLSGFYERWYDEMPETIQATVEDSLFSVLAFERGAVGQWTSTYAAHGRGAGMRMIYGSKGSLQVGGTRNGVSPVLQVDSGGPIEGDALLDLAPDYHLDEITARLYGAERPTSFRLPFPEADRKLLAIECYEFADCCLKGRAPEVDGLVGRKAVAFCYAAFESSALNRPVTLAEVEREEVYSYEAEINAHYHI
jgi:predicted dehydrogenase